MMLVVKQFNKADRWRQIIRISKDVFQVNSERSKYIFHYVRRSKAFNGPVEVEFFECSNCPGYQYNGHCWHIQEVIKVYDRDPNYDKEVKGY